MLIDFNGRSDMTACSMLSAVHWVGFAVASTLISVPFQFPAYALDDKDPKKACEIYGCNDGIPISGGGSPTPSKPEEAGRPGPKPRPVPARYCQYFEHVNFQGKVDWIQPAASYNYVGKKWNDEISSIRCSPGCTLIAYEHRDFKGATQEFPGETPFVGVGWNDRISSIRIRCK